MEAELEQLYLDSVPKPGCPGTRIDSEGREWYSAAWLDYHPADITDEVLGDDDA
jgi:hypothetical protein